MTATQAAPRPPIVLSAKEADSLSELAVATSARNPDVTRMLLEELERAEVVDDGEVPADAVVMGATVEFVVEGTGERRTVTLVYPSEADIEQGRLSILTPVGAGLIGLRVGQTITWPTRTGEDRPLRIERVSHPG